MSAISLSKPTNAQLVHGAERAIAVFVVAFTGFLKLAPNPASKDALHAAVLAGFTAIYQLVVSSLTSL